MHTFRRTLWGATGSAAADGAVETSAPLLATADAALCKLLPVSRAVEIALVDGLPRFDGSFAL